jgi:predicted MFS family arabinose efflux permease
VARRLQPAAGDLERGLAIGTLSASFDVGIVIGSLVIGFTVEQMSYGPGFGVAGAAARCAAAAGGSMIIVHGQ